MSATERRFSHPTSWPLWSQYVLAVTAVVVALAARWLLNPLLGMDVPFITVFMALLLLVLTVRPGPFLAASAVGLVGSLETVDMGLGRPDASVGESGRGEHPVLDDSALRQLRASPARRDAAVPTHRGALADLPRASRTVRRLA